MVAHELLGVSYAILECVDLDGRRELWFVTANLDRADAVAQALNQYTETTNFVVQHVEDVEPGQLTVKYRGRPVRL